jgi:peptidoglycan hydrolase CwlO-like protein
MSGQDYATKDEVEEIVERVTKRVVGDVVGGIVGDALQLIAKRFDEQGAEIQSIKSDVTELKTDVAELKDDASTLKHDVKDLKVVTRRIERKLDATREQIDDHEYHIRKLEAHPA